MVDYVDKFFKKVKKHKTLACFLIGIIIIIGIADFLGALNVISQFLFPPSSNLDVLVYNSNINFDYSNDNTTVIGFNTTVVSQITNTGKVPITIVACDILRDKVDNLEFTISNIKYLQPDESFDYNYTKYIEVSLPVSEDSPVGNFYFLVVYKDNTGKFKDVWIDLFNPIK